MIALKSVFTKAKSRRRPSFAMIACQRSGTQLLREILNSHAELALPPEPFSHSDNQGCWMNYERKRFAAQQHPPLHPADAIEMIDQYLETLQRDVDRTPDWYGGQKSSTRAIGLDVKYNQLTAVRPMYYDLRARPLLLEYFRNRDVAIIHLVRRNVLHTAISMLVANARQLWHVYDEASPPVTCRISTDELLKYMRWTVAEREQFELLTRDLHVLRCEYEEITADIAKVDSEGRFGRDATTMRRIAEFLGVDCEFRFKGHCRKVLDRPYSETIENYRDVVAAVKRSEFFQLAGTI